MDKGNNIQSDNIVSQGHKQDALTVLRRDIKCSGNVVSNRDTERLFRCGAEREAFSRNC